MAAVLSFRTLLITAVILGLFAALAGSTFAKPQGGTRPGWGFGDKNHEHTGPPGGPSVHPVKGAP